MTLDAPTLNLIEVMLSEFVTAGRVVLPPGRRDEVVGLLTRLVVNDGFRAVYCHAVNSERTRFGIHTAMMLAGDSGEIPDLDIARHGFGGRTDDQLADYAISPSAIEAIATQLSEDNGLLEHLGGWYVRAGMREVTVTPEDCERAAAMLLNLKTDD